MALPSLPLRNLSKNSTGTQRAQARTHSPQCRRWRRFNRATQQWWGRRTCSTRSKSGRRTARRAARRGPVKAALREGCRAMTAPTHCAASARCLAVMERSPAAASAPAPNTSWHVLELNTCPGGTRIKSAFFLSSLGVFATIFKMPKFLQARVSFDWLKQAAYAIPMAVCCYCHHACQAASPTRLLLAYTRSYIYKMHRLTLFDAFGGLQDVCRECNRQD